MPATNAVLHDSRYRADGIFCEPPKKLDPAVVDVEDGKEQASQSRWNTNDYHWEERDIIEFARKEVAASLVDDESARVVWQDKNGGDLVIVSATLEGDAASNVRKGKRILTYSLTLTVKCEGQRNGARLNATLSTDEFCHDDETPDVPVALKTETLDSDAGVEVQRAMKTHEMFTKVLKKKGQPLVAAAVLKLRETLAREKGQQ